MIANQILRKYANNLKAKHVTKVVLTVPNQGIKVDKESRKIWIPSLKLNLKYQFSNDFEKVNQIEIDKEYAFISVSLPEPEQYETKGYIGVDLNTTGHCAVVGNPTTGKVFKMGKMAYHIHKKYKNIRRDLQKKGKYRNVKQIRNRKQRIVSDMNHKISQKIVNMAMVNNSGLK